MLNPNSREINLAVFFTRNISLKSWKNNGTISREIKLYQKLQNLFNNIVLFTYGSKEDFDIIGDSSCSNILIKPKIKYIPSLIYSFLMPLMCKSALMNIDIIKTCQMDGSWMAVIAKKIYNKILIIRCGYQLYDFALGEKYSYWKLKIISIIEYFAYYNADRIIVTSARDKLLITKRYRIPDANIEIIPNYVDTEKFKPNSTIKIKTNRICYIGRLSPEKNVENLIKAINNLDIELVIIGSGPMQNYLEKLSQKVKTAKVFFKGIIPNEQLPNEINQSQIFVLPSFHEGCPKSLLEAMSCGKACIGANVSGIKNIIENNKNGLLCEPSLEGIRKSILILMKNQNMVSHLGKRARLKILKMYTFKSVIRKELQLYNQLVDSISSVN